MTDRGAGQGPLGRVVLAISAYRSDDAVIGLLRGVFVSGAEPFGVVIVVDSLSSGRIADEIKRQGWPVWFENAETNLGAAGNHARRMAMAATCDAEWCYTVNHDGEVDPVAVNRLLETARGQDRVGAVYPSRWYPNRGGTWDTGQRSLVPMPLRGRREPPGRDGEELTWSSSNGALYSLAPVRTGLTVWADLWHGWEDMGYGWLLHRHGWRQLQSRDAIFNDTMEYRAVRLLGRVIYITDKPAWYAYYHLRNLILVTRRNRRGVLGYLYVLTRAAQEVLITVLWRSECRTRLRLLWTGARDGLAGRADKGPVP